jgi:hypothetical protein
MTQDEKRAKRLEAMRQMLDRAPRSSSDDQLMAHVQERAGDAPEPPAVAPEPAPSLPGPPPGITPVVFRQAAAAPELPEATPASLAVPAPVTLEAEVIAEEAPGGPDSHVWFRIAEQAAAFRRPKDGVRKAVAVSADVFSRVSYVALEFNLGKIEVLTWAMVKNVPEGPLAKLPRWLVPEEDASERKTFFLSYVEDERLSARLRPLSRVFGLQTVDVVECVVLHAFPAAPHLVPSKRRRKVKATARRPASR